MSDQTIQRAQEVKRATRRNSCASPTSSAWASATGHRPSTHRRNLHRRFLKAKVPGPELKRSDLLPTSIEGVPIDVVETGPFARCNQPIIISSRRKQ